MQTFIAICSGLIVIELGIGIASFVLLALAIRQAVRAERDDEGASQHA